VETTGSPGLIELATTRIGGHSSSDAHTTYRDPAELAAAAAGDPVTEYRDRLLQQRIVDGDWLDRVDTEVVSVRRRLAEEFSR
jgi:2-oxoisovalerate dehydrogenase E1 component subunit alpha